MLESASVFSVGPGRLSDVEGGRRSGRVSSDSEM